MTKKQKIDNLAKLSAMCINSIDQFQEAIMEQQCNLADFIQQFIDLHKEGDVVPGFHIHNGHLYEGHSGVDLGICDEDTLIEIAEQIFDIK